MKDRFGFAVLVAALCASCPSKEEPTPNTPDASVADLGSDMGEAEDTGGEPDTGADMGPDTGSACTYSVDEPESIPTPDRIHTPRWAFKPWISKDISDRDDTYEFLNGFEERDIPVGTVVLDSPWETQYNTFVPNPERYPDFEQMITEFRDRDVRVVLWVTALINEISFDAEQGGDIYTGSSPNYEEAVACDFLINDARNFVWWKGRGGSLDFYNPLARQWWHEQQKPLLDMGIAGWKLDFGDSYVRLDEVETAEGTKSHQEYSEEYYKDFYDYGIHTLGHEEFVTMVRAYDKSYDFDGRFFARPEHAPVVWAGDNIRNWFGLEDALDHEFRSAKAGYVMVGSDLGGYLDRDDADLRDNIPFDRTNFHRWLAQAALTPFMQLHGRGNLTPWTLPNDPDTEETVANYRFWSHLHTELIPFWYSLAEEAYAGNIEPIMRPLGEESTWAGDYRYMLGDALLVAPILDETGVREVELPAGKFINWWTPTETFDGPTTITADFSDDLRRIPLYVKSGAIIPAETISNIGISEVHWTGADLVLAWPDETETTFVRHDEDDMTTTITASLANDVQTVTLSRAPRTVVVQLPVRSVVNSVTVNGTAVPEVTDDADLLANPSYILNGATFYVSAPAGAAVTIEVD